MENTEAKALELALSNLLTDEVTIKTPEQYDEIVKRLRDLKRVMKDSETLRKELVAPHLEKQREINGYFSNNISSPAVKTEKVLKAAITAYDEEQERKAREEQAREEERARKARARLERRAETAEAAGKEEKADELRDQADATVAPVVTPPSTKGSGISRRTKWVVDSIDVEELRAGALKNPGDYMRYLMPDAKRIADVIKALDGEVQIPGVKFHKERTVAASS